MPDSGAHWDRVREPTRAGGRAAARAGCSFARQMIGNRPNVFTREAMEIDCRVHDWSRHTNAAQVCVIPLHPLFGSVFSRHARRRRPVHGAPELRQGLRQPEDCGAARLLADAPAHLAWRTDSRVRQRQGTAWLHTLSRVRICFAQKRGLDPPGAFLFEQGWRPLKATSMV